METIPSSVEFQYFIPAGACGGWKSVPPFPSVVRTLTIIPRLDISSFPQFHMQTSFTSEINYGGDCDSKKENRPHADTESQNRFSCLSTAEIGWKRHWRFLVRFARTATLDALHRMLAPVWHAGGCQIGGADRVITATRQSRVHAQMSGSNFVDGAYTGSNASDVLGWRRVV